MKNYRNKNLPQIGLLTFNTSTSTKLVSRTGISIPRRFYSGASGGLGGAGKGSKIPGTNVPPKEGINLTPSQAIDAISNKSSQPYTPPQYSAQAEKSSSTPTTSNFPKPITPFQSNDPFKETKLPKNISTIEEKIQKANIPTKAEEKASSKVIEEQTHKEHLKEYLFKKFKEENNIKDKPTYAIPEEKPIIPQAKTTEVAPISIYVPNLNNTGLVGAFKSNQSCVEVISSPSTTISASIEEQKNTSTSLEPADATGVEPISQIPPAPSLPAPIVKTTPISGPEIAFTEQIKLLGEIFLDENKNSTIRPRDVKQIMYVETESRKQASQINNEINPEKKEPIALNNNSNYNDKIINNNNDNSNTLKGTSNFSLNEVTTVADTITTITTNSASLSTSEIIKESPNNDFSNDLKTDILTKNNNKINDEEEEEEKEFITEHYTKIQDRFNKLKNEPWSEEKTSLLLYTKNILNKYFELYPKIITEINRDAQEEYKLKPFIETARIKNIKEFLEKKQITTPRTLQEYKNEIERIQQGHDILKILGPTLPEPIFHEIIRRSGVTANNDAMYTNDMGIKTIQKECEGPMLTQKAYQILANKQEIYRKFDLNPLTEAQNQQVMENILKANYTIELFKHNMAYSTPNQEKMLESGEEVHMNIVTWYYDQENTKRFISPGCLTSNKDSTILLTQYQHVGDNNKEQRLRIYDQYIEFSPNDLREHTEATNYIKQRALKDNENFVNVFQRITEGISQKENKLKNNPVRKPYVFSREILQQLALDLNQQKLSILQKGNNALETQLNNLPEKRRTLFLKERENQSKNEIKRQDDAQRLRKSPIEIKEISKHKEILEKEKK